MMAPPPTVQTVNLQEMTQDAVQAVRLLNMAARMPSRTSGIPQTILQSKLGSS